MKYTIQDYNRQFPDENSCLEHLFNWRFGKRYPCSKCHKRGTFHKVSGRKCYACAYCAHQFFPTAGTIFHKSTTPLQSWFYAIFVMSQSKNGVAAKELERELDICYRTAWRMARQIKKLMSQEEVQLEGMVEADETYVGGRGYNNKRGRGAEHKTPVFGLIQRKTKVVARAVPNVKSSTVMPILRRNVKLGSAMLTDEFSIYNRVKQYGYRHESVEHGRKEYVRGDVHTNNLESFWSQMKRSIDGTYHSVSPKYLQFYVDEFAFRYNHRLSEKPLFSVLLERLLALPYVADQKTPSCR